MTTLPRKFIAASMIAFGLAAAPSFAQDAVRQQADALFARLDADADGFISRSEAAQAQGVAQRLAKFDSNKDGRLDKIEFAAMLAAEK